MRGTRPCVPPSTRCPPSTPRQCCASTPRSPRPAASADPAARHRPRELPGSRSFEPTSHRRPRGAAGLARGRRRRERGFAVPGAPRQLGAWVKAPTISGLIDVRCASATPTAVTSTSCLGAYSRSRTWRTSGASWRQRYRGRTACAHPSRSRRTTSPLAAGSPRRAGRSCSALCWPRMRRPRRTRCSDCRARRRSGRARRREFASVEGLQTIQGLRPTRGTDRPVATRTRPRGIEVRCATRGWTTVAALAARRAAGLTCRRCACTC